MENDITNMRPKYKKGGKREGSGHPRFMPTEEERALVQRCAANGLPALQTAALIRGGIDFETFRTAFNKDVLVGKANRNMEIGEALFREAVNGNASALIWWTKSQMQWAETKKHELSGVDGAPIEFSRIERVIVDDKCSEDQDS